MLSMILAIIQTLPAILKAVKELIPLVQEAEKQNTWDGDMKRNEVLKQYEAEHPHTPIPKEDKGLAVELAVRQVKGSK